MVLRLALSLMLACAGAACVTAPQHVQRFMLSADTSKLRAIQTRVFKNSDPQMLFNVAREALLDEGYILSENLFLHTQPFGVAIGSKEVTAVHAPQAAGAVAVSVLMTVLSGRATVQHFDKEQSIKVNLFVYKHPVLKGAHLARLAAYRIVVNTAGDITKLEHILTPQIYQSFFASISKSQFLTAHPYVLDQR